jgi:hypothetical protein
MKWCRGCIYLLAMAVLILYLPTAGQAVDKFTLKPKISASWQAESNYYKAETNEREVYTYLVRPGFELGYQTAKSVVYIDYTLDSYRYEDQDPVPAGQIPTEELDFTGHTGLLYARTQPSDRITLGLDDRFTKTRDPASSDEFSNDNTRDKYWVNRFTPLLIYKFGPIFSTELRYQNTELDYEPANREDQTEHRGMLDMVYNFTRLTSLDLQYQHWKRDYSGTTSTFTSNQVQLILSKQFQYFTFEAGGGYQNRSFEEPGIDDIDTVPWLFRIKGQNPPAPEAAPKSYISLVADSNFNDAGEGGSYYDAARFTLTAGYLFLEKLPLDFRAMYTNYAYEKDTGLTPEGTTELRDDDKYVISVKLGYIITDWLTFSVAAGIEDRDSNLDGRDYTDKHFMVSLDFGYELGSR